MRITIAAIGKAGRGPETALFEEYLKRLPWKCTLHEIDVKKNLSTEQRKTEETRLLLDAVKGMHAIMALDEQGEMPGSREFAGIIGKHQQEGHSSLGFLIGGADGLDRAQLKAAGVKTLAFGRLSWPHMLVRAMLAEQLYRAWSILEGHPYHRE